MPEGRESPPPERQSGKQQHDPPADGHGTDNADNKKEKLNDQLNNLSSNPKGAMDDALKDKFAKSEGNCTW